MISNPKIKKTKHLLLWVFVFLSFSYRSQLAGCELVVPPFTSNGVEVNHILGDNSVINVLTSPWYMCSNPNLILLTSIPLVQLGNDEPDFELWNPFTYQLQFSRPISSLTFILYIGDGAMSGVPFGAEDFVFETNESNISLSSIYSCSDTILGDTIFLGINSQLHGDGIFTITFDCPVYEFSIRGRGGGGGGSAFQICKNSIVTPYLWGRVSGDTVVCRQDSILFEAFGGVAPFEFSYTVNGGATQTLQSNTPQVWLPTPTISGVYTYNLLQVADGADSVAVIACNNSHTVVVNPSPTAQLHLSPQAGVAPLKVQVSNSSINASSYSWLLNNSPLGINCSTGSSCPVSITDTGSYIFTLVASNVYGCTDTATATFTALEVLHAIVPNVFSPNNDGVNDWFGITTSIAASAEIVIVNRWGNVVFEKAFSTKSDTFIEVWNGASIPIAIGTQPNIQIGFNAVNDGTYFYKIKLRPAEQNQEVRELSGFVEVVR